MRSLVLALLGTLALAVPAAAGPAETLFGRRAIPIDSRAGLPAWHDVLARIEAERPAWRACAERAAGCPGRAARAWQALLRGLDGEPPLRQLRAVNRFVNGWAYRADRDIWGRSDYWASPLEFLARSGDCEDYVIIKYASLRQLGFPAERLRLVVVQDRLRRLVHAVLTVAVGTETLVLDNLNDALLPDRRLSHYEPYYSVNEEHRWAHVASSTLVVSSAAASRP